MAALKLPIQGLKDAIVLSTYAWKLVNDKTVKATSDKAASALKVATLKKLVDLAKITVDRANKKSVYYNALTAKTFAVKDKADKAKAANDGVIKADEISHKAMVAAETDPISRCKVRGWAAAQAWRKSKTEADDKIKKDRAAYNTAIKPAVDGTAGTRCELPEAIGGVQGNRIGCEVKLCCGVATRINRDGSISQIESCQPEKAMKFTYKAPWTSDLAPKPVEETWPFVCVWNSEAMKANALPTPYPLPGYNLAPPPA